MEENKVNEKSKKKITSPEQLGDYIRVTSPKVWILIATVFVIVIAFFILCRSYIFETSTPVTVGVENGKGYVIKSLNDINNTIALGSNSKVIIDGKYYNLDESNLYSEEEINSGEGIKNGEKILKKLLLKEKSENKEILNEEIGDYYLTLVFQTPSSMENGYYDGKLVAKQENAFKFLFEGKEE